MKIKAHSASLPSLRIWQTQSTLLLTTRRKNPLIWNETPIHFLWLKQSSWYTFMIRFWWKNAQSLVIVSAASARIHILSTMIIALFVISANVIFFRVFSSARDARMGWKDISSVLDVMQKAAVVHAL